MREILSYEALVQEFEQSLLTDLRGHRSRAEFLEMWVPDEDPVRSLTSMFEAAQLGEASELVVRIEKASLSPERLEALKAEAVEFGALEVVEEEDGAYRLHLVIAPEDLALEGVRPAFRAAIRARLPHLRHQGDPRSAAPGETRLDLVEGDARLALVVDAENRVSSARHQGAGGPEAAVLDILCEVLEGLPLVEAGEHGAHHLLSRLSDRSEPRPVPGIVAPHNADPLFRAPVAFCRAIAAAWRARGGDWPSENAFVRAPSVAWSGLSPSAREARIREVLTSVGAIDLARIEDNLPGHPVRVIIQLAPSLAFDERAPMVRRAEEGLQALIDPALEVYVEELKDQSGIRRL